MVLKMKPPLRPWKNCFLKQPWESILILKETPRGRVFVLELQTPKIESTWGFRFQEAYEWYISFYMIQKVKPHKIKPFEDCLWSPIWNPFPKQNPAQNETVPVEFHEATTTKPPKKGFAFETTNPCQTKLSGWLSLGSIWMINIRL